jgi:hypothetical protein
MFHNHAAHTHAHAQANAHTHPHAHASNHAYAINHAPKHIIPIWNNMYLAIHQQFSGQRVEAEFRMMTWDILERREKVPKKSPHFGIICI